MSSFAAANGFAETLADPDEIQPVKTFSPPKPIAPTAAQGYFPENQFDRTDRSDHYFVTENIDQAFRPLKANSASTAKAFTTPLPRKRVGQKCTAWLTSITPRPTAIKTATAIRPIGNTAVLIKLWYSASCRLKTRNTASPTYTTTSTTTASRSSSTTHWIPNDTSPKLNARWGNADLSNTVSAEAGIIKLKRHADNYSLRPNNTPQQVFVELDRKVYDFSLKHDADFGKFHNTAAVSYRNDSQNGERNAHTAMRDFLNGYRFADVHIDRWRIADTLSYKFNDQHKLGLGLSYEINEADVRKNTAQPAHPINRNLAFASSQQIWKTHYGYDFDGKVRRHAFSGELKYDFTPSETQKYSVSLAHLERIGDNTERFNSLAAIVQNRMNGALMNQNPAAAIAGNPLLKTENTTASSSPPTAATTTTTAT